MGVQIRNPAGISVLTGSNASTWNLTFLGENVFICFVKSIRNAFSDSTKDCVTWRWTGCGPPSWSGAQTWCDPAGWCPRCGASSTLWGQTIDWSRSSAAPEHEKKKNPRDWRLQSAVHVLQCYNKSTHQLHSTEASHPQSTDDVEIVQGHTGEEIGLCLQPEPGQRTINNQGSFQLTGKCDSSALLWMKIDSS